MWPYQLIIISIIIIVYTVIFPHCQHWYVFENTEHYLQLLLCAFEPTETNVLVEHLECIYRGWDIRNKNSVTIIFKSLTLLSLTFSPISVRTPPGSSSRSGARAQACITSWNLLSSWGEPKRILSLRVAFWIQACCGTKAREPWRDRH